MPPFVKLPGASLRSPRLPCNELRQDSGCARLAIGASLRGGERGRSVCRWVVSTGDVLRGQGELVESRFQNLLLSRRLLEAGEQLPGPGGVLGESSA